MRRWSMILKDTAGHNQQPGQIVGKTSSSDDGDATKAGGQAADERQAGRGLEPERRQDASPGGDERQDPVCLMRVDAKLSGHSLEWEGVVFHFCSEGCLREFRRHPYEYVNQGEL